MSPERWLEIKRIFNEVVDLPVAEQNAFLDSAGYTGDIRREIEKMLAADSSTMLEESPLSLFAGDEYAYLTNKTIGRYRILHEVGRGGMGAVFAAVRDDGEFDRKVAVKIIKSGLNTNAIVRRFRRERQILASFEHTNIAHLLDGGMSDDGLPFYVMEFIEGRPIDEYCRLKELSVTERLELFRQVCAAVSYAHGRLIVHRDLKPSNILVTESGQAKLLDFGIAKVLSESRSAEQNTATQFGLMTPDYASPEQFRGETVTTATDVYSLGVVLYKLLSGTLPYDLNGLRLDQMLKMVCEAEPVRPSTVTYRHELAGAGSEPALVSLPFKSDLDNIILKALRKEPEQRYASVEQLSEDINRYLKGLPVKARPATFGYRARKFVGRNRAAVALSALVLLTVVGGAAATGWQAVRAERERRLAQKRFEQSRDMANSLVFKYHDAIAALPNSSPVRELLLKDASAYLDNLAQDAGGDLKLLDEVAAAYMKLGDIQGRPHSASIGNTSAAIENYEKAVALRETIARHSPQAGAARAKRDLLVIYKKITSALARAGERQEQRKEFLTRRLAIIEELRREQPGDFGLRIESAETHTAIGNRMFRADFGEGYSYYQENILPILAEAERIAPDDVKTENMAVTVYSQLGWYCAEQGRYLLELGESEAESGEYFQRALDFYERVAGIREKQFRRDPGDVDNKRGYVTGIVNTGIALRDVNRVDEALAYLNKGHELYQELAAFDPHNLQAVFDLGDYYTATALCHVKKKDYEKAVADFEKSLAHMDRVIAADDKHHEAINYKLDVLARLGNTHAEAGRLSVAVDYYEQAKNFGERNLTDEPADRGQLAIVYLNAGRSYVKFAERDGTATTRRELWKKAQAELRKALEILAGGQWEEAPKHMRVVNGYLVKCEKALA